MFNLRFATALSIGLVVGIERGWRDRAGRSGSRTAGVRTFSLTALLGAVSATLAQEQKMPLVFAMSLVTFAAAFTWFKLREADQDGDFSVTTVVAGFLVFLLGAYCMVGSLQPAAAVGVTVAALLAAREPLHGALARLTWPELRSALWLLAMTVIVLPRLPDRTIDPFDSINPREIWTFTVMAGAISYVGYIATRLLGPGTGLLVTSAAGSLISATAVIVELARRAKEGGCLRQLAGAASLACMVSGLRVMTLVAIVEWTILPQIAAPVVAALLSFALVAILLLRPGHGTQDSAALSSDNPFRLLPLLGFAAMLTGTQFAVGYVARLLGPQGILPSSALAGIVDVDVATLTAIKIDDRLGGENGAAVAIMLAMAANAVARLGYAVTMGLPAFAWPVAAATFLALGSGFLSWSVMSIWFR